MACQAHPALVKIGRVMVQSFSFFPFFFFFYFDSPLARIHVVE